MLVLIKDTWQRTEDSPLSISRMRIFVYTWVTSEGGVYFIELLMEVQLLYRQLMEILIPR